MLGQNTVVMFNSTVLNLIELEKLGLLTSPCFIWTVKRLKWYQWPLQNSYYLIYKKHLSCILKAVKRWCKCG